MTPEQHNTVAIPDVAALRGGIRSISNGVSRGTYIEQATAQLVPTSTAERAKVAQCANVLCSEAIAV
jgi:hypothetical protein